MLIELANNKNEQQIGNKSLDAKRNYSKKLTQKISRLIKENPNSDYKTILQTAEFEIEREEKKEEV